MTFVKKYIFLLLPKMVTSAFLLELKRDYSQFSLWIPIAVVKTYFVYMVLIWQKYCVKVSCVNACMGMFNTLQYIEGVQPTSHQ